MNVSHHNILLIEDDDWFAEQHIRTLRSAGFTVRHVRDGLAGMEAIDDLPPDAVVLDLFLPGPNALVLLHEIKSHADLKTLPVIMCSNSTALLPESSLGAYGVMSVLDKGTMTPTDLVAAVKKALL